MMNEVKADSVYVDRGIECGWSSEDILQPDTWRPLDGQVRICVLVGCLELEGIYEPFLFFHSSKSPQLTSQSVNASYRKFVVYFCLLLLIHFPTTPTTWRTTELL